MRLDFIDGLRGFFALSVIFLHYSVPFYHILPLGFNIFSSPVCGFFVISGFVLGLKFWQNYDTGVLTSAALRRYIRLTAAPLVSVIIAYLLMKHHLIFNVEIAPFSNNPAQVAALYTTSPHFIEAIKIGLWKMYFSFYQSEQYNFVLWTMQYELQGSFLLFSMLALFGNIKRRWLIYVIVLMIFNDSIYLTFIIGLMLSDLMYSDECKSYREFLANRKIFAVLALIVGVFFYFYASDSSFSLYAKLNFQIFNGRIETYAEPFYHIVGASLLVFAALQLNFLQKFFSSKFFTTVGKYSFSLYLVHALVEFSIVTFIYLQLMNYFPSRLTCNVIITFVGILLTIPPTLLLHQFVDMPAGRLAKRVEKFFR